MKRLVSHCPVCQQNLTISALQCPDCGLELRNRFEISVFDKLTSDQYDFLMAFLKHRGNLKNLQSEMQISYPLAKKRLDDLLVSLGVAEMSMDEEPEAIDVGNIEIDHSSTLASEIIKAKLVENGGHAMIRTFTGELREIQAAPNGKEFLCPQLIPYKYTIFDAITNLLLKSPGYRAKKGNARNFKLGEPGCEENTVAGAVLVYMGKKPGESGLDPIFILAAVLEWAGIAVNGRGYIALTANYRNMLSSVFCNQGDDMDKLAHQFEEELKVKMHRAKKECNYNPTRFNQMIAQYGGVETAKRLIDSAIQTGNTSDGFTTLLLCNRLDLTMEHSVCKQEYASLFSETQISYCKSIIR